MVVADMSQEAARWMGLIGLGASGCVVWMLLFVGCRLAGRDRWERPLWWTLPLVLAFPAVSIVGLLLS